MREKLTEYEDAMAKLALKEEKPESTQQSQPPTDNQGGLSADEVSRIVQEQLNAQRTQSIVQQNAAVVEDALTQRFGDAARAAEAVKTKAAELGLSVEMVDKLVAESPMAIISWFSDGSAPAPTGANVATHNSLAMQAQQATATEGTYAWWQNFRKENPKQYNSPAMTQKRMADAQRLGRETFFGKK